MESINFEETGGVTDDWDNGRTKSAGHNDLQSVLRMHKMQDDYRTI